MPVYYYGRQLAMEFEVVDIKQDSIISGDTAESLGLIQRIDSIVDSTIHEELSRDFPDLVKTTGILPGEYSIVTEENAKGVVHPVRKLPAAVKLKAFEKLR